jgi:hypothetical protein
MRLQLLSVALIFASMATTQLMELGLQKKADVEKRLAHYTGTLGEESK